MHNSDMDPELLRIPIKIRGRDTVQDLGAATEFDPEDLDEECAKQAALLAWWGVLHADAEASRHDAEEELTHLFAQISGEQRTQAAAKKARVTEGAIEAAIEVHPEYVLKRRRLSTLRRHELRLKAAVKAIEEKGRMLNSIGARRRAEMEVFGTRTLRQS